LTSTCRIAVAATARKCCTIAQWVAAAACGLVDLQPGLVHERRRLQRVPGLPCRIICPAIARSSS
jgi:hypothetical protein